jgi:hypothetical protein
MLLKACERPINSLRIENGSGWGTFGLSQAGTNFINYISPNNGDAQLCLSYLLRRNCSNRISVLAFVDAIRLMLLARKESYDAL